MFTWSEPDCGKRRGYVVAYSYVLKNKTGATVLTNETTATSVSFDKLTPFTKYSFSVQAMTRSGVGPASIALNVSTEERGWVL